MKSISRCVIRTDSPVGPMFQMIFHVYNLVSMVTNVVCYTGIWIVIKRTAAGVNKYGGMNEKKRVYEPVHEKTRQGVKPARLTFSKFP